MYFKHIHVVFLYIIGLCVYYSQQTVKIVILKENGQESITKWFESALKSTDAKISFEFTSVDLTEETGEFEKICASFSEGGTAVLDVTWTGNDIARTLCDEMGVPYLQVDVSISPVLIFLDKYLDYRNSTDVSMIFDNPDNVDEALYFWIDTTRLRMIISENLDKISANRLKQIRPTPNNFALVATTENMNRLFTIAHEEELVSLPERWNLVFLDFNHKNFNKNLIMGRPINLLKMNEDFCCDIMEKANCECPEDLIFQQQFAIVITKFLVNILENIVLENINLPDNLKCNETTYNAEATARFKESVEKTIETHKFIYNDDSVLRLRIEGTIEVGLNDSTDPIAEFRDNNIRIFDGKTIKPIKPFYRVGISHALPWAYKEKDPKTGEMIWTGYCADFARKLSEPELMNFDLEFVEPKEGTFGKKINGIWNGVIGDLATGDTDLAITALIMTADREEVVDFVAPYFEQTGITIVMRKPVRKTSLFKFMTVLKLEVWLSIVGALIVTGFMVWFLDKYSPYSARNNKKAYPYPCREFTLKESFWFALTSFTPQGGGEAPKALSGRTLVAAYWLFVVLMLATFTANLAAFLTVERMQAPVQSLEQLARQSRINYTVVKESDTHKYFINMKHAEDTLYRMWKELTLNASTDDTQYRVWDYPIREQYGHILLAINDSNPVINASEGFRMVDEHLDADFAFIHDSSEIKYEISRNCNFTEVGEVFAERPYAVAIQQGSHLQDEISKMILILQKERYFEQLQAKYWNHSAKGSCPSTDDSEGITLESLGGVFIATLFGLALAMITLAGEVLYYRRKRKNQDTKIKNMKSITFPEKTIAVNEKYPITFTSDFKPVTTNINLKERENVKISHISLYPRARNKISQIN